MSVVISRSMSDFLGWMNSRSRSSSTPAATCFRSVYDIILFVGKSNSTMKIEPTVFSLHEHSQFLDTIQDELRLFREGQAEASSEQAIRQIPFHSFRF